MTEIISLEDNIARMEKELESMKKKLKGQKQKEKRFLFDEVKEGDFYIDTDAVEVYAISSAEGWSTIGAHGEIWPTKELALRDLKWRKARASLIREISRINEGEEAVDNVWEAFLAITGERIGYWEICGDYSTEPFLRLKRKPTEEEKSILDPLFMVYFGVEK